MKLSDMIRDVKTVRADTGGDPEITGLTLDSRRVEPGYLFAAIPGFKQDGHEFIPQALASGAAAVLTDRWNEGLAAAQVQVEDVRLALARCAANYYGHPSRRLKLAGVTGTNGKTTTSFMLHSILATGAGGTALIGGIEYRYAGERIAAARTTPESVDLQRMLAQAVAGGDTHGVIEVSSHGIELNRTAFVDFDVAVFTNLTRDHLDLHQDMEDYYQVKRRLFIGDPGLEEGRTEMPTAAVNSDNEYGRRLAEEIAAAGGETVTFGAASEAAVSGDRIIYSGWKTAFVLKTPDGSVEIELHLPGAFNLSNALGAAAGAFALGLSTEAIAAGLNGHRGAPGRFESVDTGGGFHVVIDYAHNEDGLAQAIGTARKLTPGKLIVVFGCPGERDRDKRPHMGRLAGAGADLAILTTDDCYAEPPEEILDAAETGLREAGGEYRRIADRREAIASALAEARDGDTVLIAGKGHETVQVMPEGPVKFNDRQVVEELID